MPKLKLNVDELRVESFDVTSPRSTPRGTVHGADVTDPQPVTEPDNKSFFDACPSDINRSCPDSWCGFMCTESGEAWGCSETCNVQQSCGGTCPLPCFPGTGWETCGSTCGCSVGGVPCA